METDIDEILRTIRNVPAHKDRISVPMDVLRKMADYIEGQEEMIKRLKGIVKEQQRISASFMARAMVELPDKLEMYA